MKLDEAEDGEGTTTRKVELTSGEGREVDAVTLALLINVDVWFMLVVDWAKREALSLKIADDGIKSWEDVEGNILLSTNVDDTTTSEEGLFTLDGTLVTAWGKVEVLFPSTADADGSRSEEDVEGKVPLSINVDEITIPTEELCTLDDSLTADWAAVEVLLRSTTEDLTMPADNEEGDVTLVLSTTLLGDGVVVSTTFVTDKLAWAVLLFTASDACNTELSLPEDDTSILRDCVSLGVRSTCTVADDGLCV